ncbi:hypothetical protein [Streptomyces olivochromogenes]|uniref:hypothetical protein n=1 Tax=Streptomyces olivochromogenes TaxID=1963 RepID=UPI001F491A64|nr:hypothetical protein [Streptomyces olivochromogenes]MCF3131180.1 hypothetical protein [Streptomyces olivochromogenes]
MLDPIINAIAEGARRQRLTDCTIYSAIVPLIGRGIGWQGVDPKRAVQDQVSQAIHLVEQEGWQLDRMSTYTVDADQERALLIFRKRDR